MILRATASDRQLILKQAQQAHERYIERLDTYRMLIKSNSKLYERYIENRDGFSLVESNDASTRRDAKIQRFREEKELKAKLDVRTEQSLLRQI